MRAAFFIIFFLFCKKFLGDEGNDYVIIECCARTGNLKIVLTDEILSHTIINTYELHEWIALKIDLVTLFIHCPLLLVIRYKYRLTLF